MKQYSRETFYAFSTSRSASVGVVLQSIKNAKHNKAGKKMGILQPQPSVFVKNGKGNDQNPNIRYRLKK